MSAAFQIFTQPSQQALDTAANVLSGATLTFSLTGTSTATNAYSDSTLTTPVANPLSANSAGVFIPVFLNPAVIYRVVLKTSAGAVLQTWDPANEQILTAAGIGQLLYPLTAAEIAAPITPADFSRIPDLPVIDVRRYGVADTATAAANTTAIANAISAIPSDGGVLMFPFGIFNHNGITLKARVILRGAGRQATNLVNAGAGVGITVPSLGNSCAIEHMQVTGGASTTHGIRVIDSLYFRATDLFVKGWGTGSTGILMDSVASPGGNGTFFAEFRGVEIDGILRATVKGIHFTGTAAGANRARYFGGVIHNCDTGLQASGNTDGLVVVGTEFNGNATAVNLTAATNCVFVSPIYEANTEHNNIGAGSTNNTFLFPLLATPSTFGTDSGTRTSVVFAETGSTGPGKLSGDMNFGGRLAATNYGFTAGVVVPVVASASVTTVVNTVTQTALTAGFTAPASSLLVGDVFEVWASGVYSTANGADTVTLRFAETVGGTIIWDHTTTAAAVTNKGWMIHGYLIVTAQGVGGAVEAQIESQSNGVVNPAGNTAAIAIGTTGVARTFKVIAIWSNALAGNTVSLRQFVMKAMNKQ